LCTVEFTPYQADYSRFWPDSGPIGFVYYLDNWIFSTGNCFPLLIKLHTILPQCTLRFEDSFGVQLYST
jgi:hypothetical protein